MNAAHNIGNSFRVDTVNDLTIFPHKENYKYMNWENTLIEIGITIFRCGIMVFAFLMAKFIVPYLRRKQLSKSTLGERIKIYLGGVGSCLVISIMWAEYRSILIYFSILSISTISGLYFGLKTDSNLSDKEREQKNMKEELEDHKKKYG